MTEPIHVNNLFYGKIGDTIVAEPALSYLSYSRDRPVHFHNVHPDQIPLFYNHDRITAFDHMYSNPDFQVSAGDAFMWSHANNLPFGAGFYHQLGLEAQTPCEWKKHHYSLPGLTHHIGQDRPTLPYDEIARNSFANTIIIVPYGRSCTSRPGAPGPRNHTRPNVEPPAAWWAEVVPKLTLPSFCICSNDTVDGKYWEEDFPYCHTIRGLPLLSILSILRECALLISVETGILHLASGTKTPTIFLSSATPIVFSKPNTECRVVRAPYADEFSAPEVILHHLEIAKRTRKNIYE